MANVSVRQALQFVADHPQVSTDETIQVPAWELVSRALFDIANTPNVAVRGSMVRATKAQRIILDRLVGMRRAGTSPSGLGEVEIDFIDLTGKVLE